MYSTTRLVLLACVASTMFLGMANAADNARECPPPPFPDGPPPPPPWGGGPGFGPPHGPGGGPGRFMADSDANNDGMITHAEIDAGIRADFDKADANHDGSLDGKEFVAGLPKPPEPPDGMHGRPPRDPAAALKRADWNGDGKISLDEFALPRRAMAQRADRNGDGVVSEADRPDFEKGGPPPN